MQKLVAGFFVPGGNEPGISFPGSDPLQMTSATLAGNGFDYHPLNLHAIKYLARYVYTFLFSTFSDLKMGGYVRTI